MKIPITAQYHVDYDPGSRTPTGYFIGKSGLAYDFATIAYKINSYMGKEAKDLKGVHIFKQLKFLDLWEEFQGGETPIGLPYSFHDVI